MGDNMKFDYYYGIEADQFSFYKIPRLLVKDARFRELSSDAKLLYGLMLDRMSLSMKNNWLDEENRAYIYYTMENIMDDLGCAKEKCAKVLAELDSKKGYGLIEKKRQGLGKPDIIYVMNFVTIENNDSNNNQKEPVNADNTTEVRKTNFKKFENQTSESSEIKPQEVRESNLSKFGNQTLESSENEPQEVRKANTNYTNTNYTDLNYTKIELIIGDTSSEVAQNKVARIYSVFRKKGQVVPQPMNIVSKETAVSGVDKVIFKKITHKRENKTDLWVATLEFCEYVPVPIKVTSAASAASTAGSASLSADYQNYLSSDRGTAPRLGDKTTQSPTVDDRLATSWSVSLDSLRWAS